MEILRRGINPFDLESCSSYGDVQLERFILQYNIVKIQDSGVHIQVRLDQNSL